MRSLLLPGYNDIDERIEYHRLPAFVAPLSDGYSHVTSGLSFSIT